MDTGRKWFLLQKGCLERFYHGFVLGLIVELSGRYQIASNRESGFGRYDVMFEPEFQKTGFANTDLPLRERRF